MKNKKRCRILCGMLLCVFSVLPMTAGALQADPNKGYPYDDDSNFKYQVEAHPTIPSGWNGADYVIANKITVRDATQSIPKIISVDDYIITFKNLPKFEAAGKENTETVFLYNEETKPNEVSTVGYTTSYDIRVMGMGDREQSWQNFMDNTANSANDSNSKNWEGNLGNHRALFFEYNAEPTVNANRNYRFSSHQFGSALVELEDIIYPNAGLYINISWDVSSSYYLGSRWDNTEGFLVDETNLPEAKALHEAAMIATKDFVSRFANVSYTVQKNSQVSGEVPVKDKNTDIKITTNASSQQGEDDFSIPAAVILGIAAAAAGAAGAGVAAAGSSEGKSSGDGESGSFQMIIGKDFGDALKYGQKQRVWARMAELKNGIPVDRPDLTAGISIFSREILVGASSLRGGNVETEVQIQENAPQEGVISFLYSGEHGTFQNNVRFRLLGKGEIRLASDKVNILSTDAKPFELVYELKNFTEEEPPLEITASSGFVALDMGKNDKQQTVILITPGLDAEQWNGEVFIERCKCEITAMDGKIPITAAFEVNVCFEGIGTAYENLAADKLEKDALIQCFTEAEKEKRTEKALWIPLTVMKWNEKSRTLEPDSAKADNLTWSYAVHPDFEFKTPESKRLAERVVTKAKLKAERLPAPATLKTDTAKKPSAYRIMAEADPDEGAALFDIRMIVVCEGDAALAPLELTAQLKPNPDFKGMVRWFLEYPLGSAAADFITLGNVDTYHAALDFIESRVYPMSGVPWSSNLLWNRESDSHYEHGRGDIMRESYIAIKDGSFPKGINANEFKKVQTLVHELAHVIEDQHGSYQVDATSETHTYYLQHLSDVTRGLADLESNSSNPKTDVWYAIKSAYWFNVDPEIIGDINNIGPWFGGKFSMSIHELFDKYAYHIETIGGKMDEAQRQAVAQEFRHWYFPGNLSLVTVQRGGPTDAIGRFTDTNGPFKDAEWKFSWNQGVLESVAVEHSDYIFDVLTYRWTGGNELKLQMEIKVSDKNLPSYNYDYLSVTLDGGTFNTQARSFPSVRSFDVKWRSANDHQHSLLFKKLGFSEATSWMERKK